MKLIDKAAVVAEIEEVISGLRRNCNPNPLGNIQECLADAEIEALNLIKDSLDTLEVKEVDLDKIINDYFKDWKFDDELDIMVKPNNYSVSFNDLKEIAKHFYELGIKTKKNEG